MEMAAGTGLALIGAVQQSYSGKAQAEGMKAQAYQEKLRAQEEGNLRRERLLKALAAQNVRAGALGISGGSVQGVALESTQAFEREQSAASLMSNLEQSRLREGAKQARRQGNLRAGTSLLSTGTQLASIG